MDGFEGEGVVVWGGEGGVGLRKGVGGGREGGRERGREGDGQDEDCNYLLSLNNELLSASC